MSDVVVHHIGGGGGGAYAFVIVNYPAGSTVTCTNSAGSKDISSTQKLFYVKKTATSCTVTATLGSQSTSATVTGITEGSSKTVTLAYELKIYDRGVQDTAVTGGLVFSSGVQSDFSFNTSDISINISKGGNGRTTEFRTQNNLDLSTYSTINIRSAVTAGAMYYKFAVEVCKASDNSTLAKYEVIQQTYNEAEHAIDISSIGSALSACYVKIVANVYSGDNNAASITAEVHEIIAV